MEFFLPRGKMASFETTRVCARGLCVVCAAGFGEVAFFFFLPVDAFTATVHFARATSCAMASEAAHGMTTRTRKRDRHDGDVLRAKTPAREAIPGLLNDVVVTHVFGVAKMPDPADLARLRVVSRGMRDAVAATGLLVNELSTRDAVRLKCYSALKRLLRGPARDAICQVAARAGALEVLQWARENGCPWSVDTCMNAGLGGHLEVLQWVRANGCVWDAMTCTDAARGGHLEVLQWARANDCQWSEGTCSGVGWKGHLEVLQWARANGCPWNANTSSWAAEGGHLEVLQWALANGCPWGADTCY